jgi:hypothetical protein
MIVAQSHLPLKLDAISTTMIIIVALNKTLAIKVLFRKNISRGN